MIASLLLRLIILVAFLPCFIGQVAAADPEGSAMSMFNVTHDRDFSNFREPLISYLKSRQIHRNTSVCIFGEKYSDGTRSAWVLWQSGKTLLLWGGGESSMIGSKRILDLTRDVVATEAAVNGSTYLVTKAWVKEQQKKCAEFGTEVRITAGDLSKGQKTTQAK